MRFVSASSSSLVRVALLAILLGLPACSRAQQRPPSVTVAQFQQLQWLAGTWRGSGGAYPAFYEEYRVVDDSTMLMRAFSDSTLRTVTDSSRIELRNGTVVSRGERTATPAIEVTATQVRFRQAGAASGGFTFSRVSDDEWTATLHPATANGRETVYVMRRIGQ